ncbi:MAG: hypothetical protein J6Y33_02835 [Prevotella sp.]|nr:hypothetical protein [Prevotella sp.]
MINGLFIVVRLVSAYEDTANSQHGKAKSPFFNILNNKRCTFSKIFLFALPFRFHSFFGDGWAPRGGKALRDDKLKGVNFSFSKNFFSFFISPYEEGKIFFAQSIFFAFQRRHSPQARESPPFASIARGEKEKGTRSERKGMGIKEKAR